MGRRHAVVSRTQAATRYAGPRPAPAARVAPWFVLAGGVALAANVALVVLELVELVERSFQEGVSAGKPVTASAVHTAIAHIHTMSVTSTFATIGAAVLGVVWLVQRRSRRRLMQHGEAGVEQRLSALSPRLFTTVLAGLVGAVMATTAAREAITQTTRTASDFADYRGFLAAAAACRCLMWAAMISLVVVATRFQDRREVAPLEPTVAPTPRVPIGQPYVSAPDAALSHQPGSFFR